MSLIEPNMILTDRRGQEWRTAPSYQDREPNAAGWLLLRSAAGEELPFADVVDLYGYRDAEDRPHLRGRSEAPAPKPGWPDGLGRWYRDLAAAYHATLAETKEP